MRSNDLNISRMLVWLSLMMLAAFLIYWNFNQYDQEKKELSQDLNDQMSLAHSKLNDSLFNSIFTMMAMDTLLGDFHVQTQFSKTGPKGISIDGLSKLDTSISITINSEMSHISEKDSLVFISNTNAISGFSHSSNHDTSGVFISQYSDVGNESDYKKWDIFMQELSEYSHDNETVMLYFMDNLNQQGLPLQFNLDSNVNETVIDGKSIAIPFKQIDGSLNQKQAVFTDYKGYLFSKILPSILMSSFLFGFMSLAFFFINRTRKTQERLIEMKSEFISNMTHELKTPISTIGVAIESLSDFGTISDTVKKQEYFDISKHELNRLNILVDKVMKMASFESGEVSMEFEELDLRILLEKMLKSMSLHFDKHQVDLQYDAIGEDFMIKGDQIHLTNVLYNLIDNAIKYAKDQPEIIIEIREDQASVELSIQDKGVGIPKEYLNQVFDRFFRVPTKDIHNVKGYGIGLHYSAGVIKKHLGSIDVESTEGTGTNFIIKLDKTR